MIAGMPRLITFETGLFDPATEPENPINPIHGASVLDWLRAHVDGLALSEPAPEDWGWYACATHAGADYLIGASLDPGPSGRHTCMVNVEKRRSLFEKLCGRGKMRDDDPVLAALLSALRKEPAFSAIDCEE
jgi:hypothetical protein